MRFAETILREVARDFDFPVTALRGGGGKRRGRKTQSTARHVAMWLYRFVYRPQPSFLEIGASMGFDHGSVMRGVNRVSYEVNQGTEIGNRALAIADRLAEIDSVRFALPDVSAEVLQKGDDSYRKNLLMNKVRERKTANG